MKRLLIAIVIITLLTVVAFATYQRIRGNGGGVPVTNGVVRSSRTLPAAPQGASSSISDYIGNASEIFHALPTGDTLAIGTPDGTVSMTNFYASDPPVDEAGDLVIKQGPGYYIVYDPPTSSFWLGIVGGVLFDSTQHAAEEDFLQTLGINKSDACKLDVSSGVIYTPGDPNDGKDFSLTFCAPGAFTQ